MSSEAYSLLTGSDDTLLDDVFPPDTCRAVLVYAYRRGGAIYHNKETFNEAYTP